MSQGRPTELEVNAYAERFVLCGKRIKSFKAAFPKSKGSLKTQTEKASVLHKLDVVQDRIKELRITLKIQAEDKFQLSTEKLQKTLAIVMRKGLKNKTDAQGNEVAQSLPAVVSAVSEVNKMNGNHAPTKIGIGGDPDAPPVLTSDISDEQLAIELAKYGIKPESS